MTRVAKRCGGIFDYDSRQQRLAQVERELAAPDLWQDRARAQTLSRERAALSKVVEGLAAVAAELSDASELAELAAAERDAEALGELDADLDGIESMIGELEFRRMFNHQMDPANAFLEIQSGSGGTEAQDWAEMLQRMYLRWAEKKGYATEITDMTQGEEAGIKSVTITVDGSYAYGYLQAERGTHRLVRLSPFDAGNRRHTSFAKLEVMPIIDEDIEIEIAPNDIRMDVFLSSGAGGQSVQKNATAVRLHHIPTGIVVSCQNERSQTQNREIALRILRGKLYAIEQEKIAAEKARLKGENVQADFGSQIRSYVLHPYQMVKDLRTNVETASPQTVLDGDLDQFIEAWLKGQVGT